MPFLAQFYPCKECRQKLGVIPGLGDEVCGTALQSPYCFISIGVGSHEDDDSLCIAVQDVLQPLEALLSADSIACEIHIQQHHIGMQQIIEPVNLFGILRHADVFY